MQMYKQEPQNL